MVRLTGSTPSMHSSSSDVPLKNEVDDFMIGNLLAVSKGIDGFYKTHTALLVVWTANEVT